MPPLEVRVETIEIDERLRSPYRGVVTMHPRLRLTVSIAPRGTLPCEVTLDVDDATIEICDHRGCIAVTEIDQLFVVERQPPAWRFLTWFGVFARRRGHADLLLVETPDGRVARFVERMIEQRLGLRDEPVRGEVRSFGDGFHIVHLSGRTLRNRLHERDGAQPGRSRCKSDE